MGPSGSTLWALGCVSGWHHSQHLSVLGVYLLPPTTEHSVACGLMGTSAGSLYLCQAWSLQFGLWTGGFSPLCTSSTNKAVLDEVGSESGARGSALAASAASPFPSSHSGAGDPLAMHRPQLCLWITVRDTPAEGSPELPLSPHKLKPLPRGATRTHHPRETPKFSTRARRQPRPAKSRPCAVAPLSLLSLR